MMLDAAPRQVLKSDLFGHVELLRPSDGTCMVIRDTRTARWWIAPLARWLAAREAKVLRGLPPARTDLPQLQSWSHGVLQRSFVAGRPMQQARPTQSEYFRKARRLVAQLHRHGIVHNDLAKEPNWIVDGAEPGLVDFQLAFRFRRRGRVFRLMAREDLRHLLKHKRTYCPQALTAREQQMLATPSLPARLWRRTGKLAYHVVTRSIFRWSDREGAGDRVFLRKTPG